MRRALLPLFQVGVVVLLSCAAAASVVAGTPLTPAAPRDRWSAQELAALAAMQRHPSRPAPADPSNAYEGDSAAAALGRALFEDAGFSRDGQVACASCHAADKDFQDARPTGKGVGLGTRRTMPVMGAARSPFLFWDGRKDSLWSQALGPLEDAAEHGGNRLRLVTRLRDHYGERYRAVFGAIPALDALPADASPNGTAAERAAWAALPAPVQQAVNRMFANMGKAIAAYERRLHYGPSRLDRYIAATLARDGAGQAVLSVQEVRGLGIFLNQGQCATCHGGPELSDHAFHNTGVPPAKASTPDRGRADGVRKLRADEFNCLGRYSDATPGHCGELQYLALDDPAQVGAFRTPSLRNVGHRAPYMHAGQMATLEEVLAHYARSPPAAVGLSELAAAGERHATRRPIRLGAQDIEDVVAFLRALSGPVLELTPDAPVASAR
jgi:cytochrome c peroxidase